MSRPISPLCTRSSHPEGFPEDFLENEEEDDDNNGAGVIVRETWRERYCSRKLSGVVVRVQEGCESLADCVPLSFLNFVDA